MTQREPSQDTDPNDIVRITIYRDNHELMVQDDDGNYVGDMDTFNDMIRLMYANEVNPTNKLDHAPLYDASQKLVAIVTSEEPSEDEIAAHVARVDIVGTIH